MNYGQAALPIAAREIGVKEFPAGSNTGPRVRVYLQGHPPEPWCADFGTWCLLQVGFPAPKWNWSYCPAWEEAARGGMVGMCITDTPAAGDVVLYDWDGGGVADHFGLVEVVGPGNSLTCIEGNTSAGNNSNGGQVQRRADRVRSEVRCFIRLPQMPKDFPTEGDATLRLYIEGHDVFAGWAECEGPIVNIARNGLKDSTTCAIAWKGETWHGAKDVTNVCKHLTSQFKLV